jgi:hypothetical protein
VEAVVLRVEPQVRRLLEFATQRVGDRRLKQQVHVERRRRQARSTADGEALSALGDPLTCELAEAAVLTGVLALLEAGRLAKRILAERLFELLEVPA